MSLSSHKKIMHFFVEENLSLFSYIFFIPLLYLLLFFLSFIISFLEWVIFFFFPIKIGYDVSLKIYINCSPTEYPWTTHFARWEKPHSNNIQAMLLLNKCMNDYFKSQLSHFIENWNNRSKSWASRFAQVVFLIFHCAYYFLIY